MLKQNSDVKEKIVDGKSGTLCIYDDNIVFSPPLYQQRYQKVKEKIAAVSKGTFTKDNEFRINPLAADFLILRDHPLNVKAVCGDARKYDPVLSGTHVVTMIELIEHMQISELHALVKCVFQDVRPKLIIITTPNADFNKYFPDHMPGSFRHWDHKFEWTAEEFRQWCQEIIEDNSSYYLEYSGCGLGPDSTYCTQMAFFFKSTEDQEALLTSIVKENLKISIKDSNCCEESLNGAGITKSADASIIRQDSYKIITEFDYPVDSRTQEEKDRAYTLARFYSLMNYLRMGERGNVLHLDSEGITEEDTENKCTDRLIINFKNCPQETSTFTEDVDHAEDEHIFFSSEYVKSEEAIHQKKRTDNEYVFYIVDHKYAVIPLASLSIWVNIKADHKISHCLIRNTVADDCFETIGSGEDWQGKVQLCHDSTYTSSDESGEDCVQDDDRYHEGWLAGAECMGWSEPVIDYSDNVNTTVNPQDKDWDWDVPDVPEDPRWN